MTEITSREHSAEALSAFVDGEDSDSGQILPALLHDTVLLAKWERYHLISACLQNMLPAYRDPGMAARVGRAVRAEPPALAVASSYVRRLVRPVVGFAIAASVAALAIFGVHQARTPDAGTQQQMIAAGAPFLDRTLQSHLRLAARTTSSESFGPQPTAAPAGGSRMNRYLVNHNEYRSNAAVQGMLPYVRLVSHGNDN